MPPTAAELLPKVATSELSTHPLDGSCYSSFDATQCVKPTFCSLTPAWANKTSSYAATYTYTGSSKTMADAWAHLTNGEVTATPVLNSRNPQISFLQFLASSESRLLVAQEWFAAAFGFQMIRPGFLSDFGLGHVRLLINKQHNLPSQIETIITASPPSDDSPAFGSYEALFTLFCAAMQPAIATYGVEPIYVSLEESTPGTFTVTFSGNTCGPTKVRRRPTRTRYPTAAASLLPLEHASSLFTDLVACRPVCPRPTHG